MGRGAADDAGDGVPADPSEVVLPLAGFLSSQDQTSIPLVLVTSTLGAYLGALVLYALAARLGRDRSIRLLSRLPLVEWGDLERADRGFSRHARRRSSSGGSSLAFAA